MKLLKLCEIRFKFVIRLIPTLFWVDKSYFVYVEEFIFFKSLKIIDGGLNFICKSYVEIVHWKSIVSGKEDMIRVYYNFKTVRINRMCYLKILNKCIKYAAALFTLVCPDLDKSHY